MRRRCEFALTEYSSIVDMMIFLFKFPGDDEPVFLFSKGIL